MNLLLIAFTEIKRQFKSIPSLMATFAMPLVLIFILGSSLSGLGNFETKARPLDKVKVGLQDNDRGQLSSRLDDFIQEPEVNKLVELQTVDSREQLEQDIRNGLIQFGVVIPSGFSEGVLLGNTGQWEFIMGNDYSQNTIAKTLFQSFLDQVNLSQSVAKTLGTQQVAVAATEVSVNTQSIEAPLLITGKLSQDGDNLYSAFQYYSVSILIMFLLYTGRDAAVSIMVERENYTLQRLQSLPIRSGTVVFGKILGNSIIAFMQAIIIISITNLFYGVEWGDMWGILALTCFLIILSAMGLGMVILLKAKTTKTVHSTFQIIVIVMTALSGGFAPIGGLESVSQFTISYWGMQGMLRIMLNSDAGIIMQQVTVLGLIGAGLMFISVVAYRKVVS